MSSSVHSNLMWLLRTHLVGFLWLKETTSDQKFLELKHIVMNMLVLLQESMFILRFLKLEELRSQTIDTCLHSNLHIFNLMSSSYQFSHCLF